MWATRDYMKEGKGARATIGVTDQPDLVAGLTVVM